MMEIAPFHILFSANGELFFFFSVKQNPLNLIVLIHFIHYFPFPLFCWASIDSISRTCRTSVPMESTGKVNHYVGGHCWCFYLERVCQVFLLKTCYAWRNIFQLSSKICRGKWSGALKPYDQAQPWYWRLSHILRLFLMIL